ncbi:MAG: hypothetical protein GY925_08050 [Actinomycetia bacterium]|nr:hypothetical protein [Actinomycetes bacterium]
MFGKRRTKRWDAETAERNLVEVADATEWIGIDLDVLRPEISRSFERKRLLMPNGSPVRYDSTRRTEILRSMVNTSLHGPGLLAAIEVRVRAKTTSRDEIHHKSTRMPKGQVLVGRLPRSVGGQLVLSPHYSPKLNERFENRVRDLLGDDISPFRLEHPLLQHWWLEAWGTIEPDQLAADTGLCALLWAVRTKVSGAEVHAPDLAAVYEAMIPPCEQFYDAPEIEIHGDIVAMYRHTPVRGLDDAVADQVAHVTQHFR